ncbi:MAG: WD40 repeat domain-containing protein [Planctomycetota bacterium]
MLAPFVLSLAALCPPAQQATGPLQDPFEGLPAGDRELDAADLDVLEALGVLRRLGAPPRGAELGGGTIDWSPDGKRILQVNQEGACRLWDARSGVAAVEGRLTNGGDEEATPGARFLGDGRLVACWSDSRVRAHGAGDLSVDEDLGGLRPCQRLERSADHGAFATVPPLFADDASCSVFTATPLRRALSIAIEDGTITHAAIANGAEVVAVLGADGDLSRRVLVRSKGGDVHPAEAPLQAWIDAAVADGQTVANVAVSPDGALLALGCHGLVALFDVASGDLIEALDTEGALVSSMRFTPKGDRLVVGDFAGFVSAIRTKRPRVLFTERAGFDVVLDLAIAPKGDRVALVTKADGLVLFDLKKKRETLASNGPRGPVTSIAFDGAQPIVETAAGETWRWSVETGQPTRLEPAPEAAPLDLAGVPADSIVEVARSRDGESLAVLLDDGRTLVVTGERGAEPVEIPPPPQDGEDPPWPADVLLSGGEIVIVTNADVFEVYGTDGSHRRSVPAFDGLGLYSDSLRVAAHPRGGWAASQLDIPGLGLHDLSGASTPGRLRFPGATATSAAFSDDGARLAFGMPDGRVWIWDCARLADVLRGALDPASAFVPPVGPRARARMHNELAALRLRNGSKDGAAHHQEQALRTVWLSEPAPGRDAVARWLTKKAKDHSLLHEDRAKAFARAAAALIDLEKAYRDLGRDALADLAREEAASWTPKAALRESDRTAAGDSPAPAANRALALDAEGAQPGWSVVNGEVRALNRYDRTWIPVLCGPSEDVVVEALVDISAVRRRGAGLVVGLDEDGLGGVAGYLFLDVPKERMELVLLDLSTGRRLARRSFPTSKAAAEPRHVRLEVEDDRVTLTVDGQRAVTGGTGAPVRGRHGPFVADCHDSNRPVVFRDLAVTPEPGPARPRTKKKGAAQPTALASLRTRLEKIEARRPDPAAAAALHRLEAETALLADPALAEMLAARIRARLEATDPDLALRRETLRKSARSVIAYARKLIDAGHVAAAAAVLERAERLDPDAAQAARAKYADELARAVEVVATVGAGVGPPGNAAAVHARFEGGLDPHRSGWAFNDDGATVAPAPQRVAVMLQEGAPLTRSSTIRARLRARRGASAGLVVGWLQEGAMVTVAADHRPGIWRLNVASRASGASDWASTKIAQVPAPAGLADPWFDLAVRFEPGAREIEVAIGDGPWRRLELGAPIAEGRAGVIGFGLRDGCTVDVSRFDVE